MSIIFRCGERWGLRLLSWLLGRRRLRLQRRRRCDEEAWGLALARRLFGCFWDGAV